MEVENTLARNAAKIGHAAVFVRFGILIISFAREPHLLHAENMGRNFVQLAAALWMSTDFYQALSASKSVQGRVSRA